LLESPSHILMLQAPLALCIAVQLLQRTSNSIEQYLQGSQLLQQHHKTQMSCILH
jgi:hypothetical protein